MNAYSNHQILPNESSHSQNLNSGSNKKKDRSRDRDKSMRNSLTTAATTNLSNSTKVSFNISPLFSLL